MTMTRKVLIVDDNSANLYMLESLLKGYGLEVISADNGKDALDKARINPPDLVVTDILMPVMDGYALCREWKSDDTLKHIPLVFYTATYTEPRDEKFALSLGADRFIIKPQEPDIFMNMIKEVLEEKYTARQAAAKPLGEEMEFFRRYNEILFKKLEKKMSDLEIANQKLMISEEMYRLSFQNTSDVIYTIDAQLNLLSISPGVEKILGYNPQDFIGRPVSDIEKILTPESFEQAMADIRLILKGDMIPAAVYRYIAKDGTVKYGEVSSSPIMREGTIIGIISVARDITERKQVEDKLRKSEIKYRDLYDFLPIPVYEMDLEANIISANRAIYETFRGTEEDVKKGFKVWQILSPEEIEKSSNNIQRLLKGEIVEGTEYILKRLDGSAFPAIVISSVIYADSKPIGLRGAIVDITERRRTEEALLAAFAQRQELEFIVNHSPAVVWLWKAAEGWPVEYVSDNVTLYGYTPDDFTSGRIAFASIVHPDDLPKVVAEVEQYTNEGRTEFTQEYRIFTKSGEIHWIDDRAWVRRSPGGSATHYQGIAIDITERKQAEEDLRESQQQLADIINFLPDATLVIDTAGKVIAWNRAIEMMTGVKAAEMLGKDDYEYSVPFYGERRPILIDLVLQPKEVLQGKYKTIKWHGDVLVGEAYITNLRGNPVYLLGTASPLYDTKGSIVGAIETIRDITDRRQMEEELASEHDRLAAILDGIPIPAFVIDRDQVVVLWNRNNEIFTGKTKEEILGKRQDLSFLFKDKSPPSLAELVLKMTDEELMRKYGSRGVHKSDVFPGAFESVGTVFPRGEERLMSIQAARIYNPQGEVNGAVQTAQDITERVRIQEDREKLQSQLIQAQKMEAIGTLAGGIAHDFNNILSGIMGYTELYKEAVKDRPKVYHGMEQVLKAAERAKDLVRQILTFSRKTEHEKKPIALAPIVQEVVKFMRASLPRTIEIVQRLEETSDVIMGDPTQLHQVLINLCTNAGHAMKDTGGVLDIGLEEIVIHEDDFLHRPPIRNGHYLALTVRDTGEGISRENLARIFEPYFTTKEKGEGTGLGLAVVHGIVKDHGGEIRVYSELGKGTIFRVYLPLMKMQAEDEKGGEETILAGQGETILFVDDEKMVANLSKELLEKLGYRVVMETDPVKAIEIFRENSNAFDLVITDKTMPNLTGFDVVREIRHIHADIPVILCSGFQEKGDLEKITALNISRLITKPIKMSALSKAIRDVLDKDTFEKK
jgi:PAS domain S-box-containing protein